MRQTVKVDGRVADIFALQDKIVYELSQGLNLVLRGTEIAEIERRETQVGRGLRELRARHDEPAAGQPRLDRARHRRVRARDAQGSGVRARVGRARRRLQPQGLVPQPARSDRGRDRDRAARARRSIPISPTRTPGSAPRCSTSDAPTRRSSSIREAIRLEPDNGQAHQALARAYWVGKGDFAAAIPEFEQAIELNPDAGYSYLQLALLLAWEGQYARAEEVSRRAVELQDQYISGNAGLQVVGANGRLGYVYYLQGRYDDALREYERGLSFVGSSDHALKDRTAIELNVKMGAAYHRQGRQAEAVAALRSRAQDVRQPGREGRRRSVHPLLHRRACTR